jgi:hypothetical protein
MLESKDHWQNIDSSGALDLTFALQERGKQGSERQIRSTSGYADRLTFRSVEVSCEPGRFIGTETDLFQHADAGPISIVGADNLLDMKMLRRERIELLRIE